MLILTAKRCMERVGSSSRPAERAAEAALSCWANRRENPMRWGLNGSSGKLCRLGQECDAGLTTGTMAPPLSPDERMAVRVPVIGRLRDGGGDLVPGLEATSGQGKRVQDLPPRLDQVEGGGVFGLEHHLPAWMGQHEQQHVGGAVAAQVVGDGVDPLDILRQPALDVLQEGHPVGGPTPRVGSCEGGSRRGAESPEDIALAAPAVVDLLPSPACMGWLWSDQVPSRVAFGAERAHLVQADD